MTRATTLLLPALLCAACLSAQPKWIQMQNENFRVYSSAKEYETRKALDEFERVRSFFLQTSGAPPAKPVPISIIIFGTEKEYQAYRFNEFAIAYYAGQSDRDFIVIGKLGEQSSQIATHEYTHLVFRHAGYTLPPWLNEGTADLFSTLHSIGKDVEFGSVMLGRLQALSRDAWVPMETILAADQSSPYYNETKQAGSLYNQSWALVHMLATTQPFIKFWELIEAVQKGTPSVKAIEAVYGKPFPEIEKDLKFYIKSNSFKRLIMKLKLDGVEKLAAQPADMFDVREAQAEILMGLKGKQAEAKTRFEELTREDAKRPEPWANLGYLVWRDGKPSEATGHFAKAFELGNRNPRLLWDYARLVQGDKPENAAAAFAALLDLEPQNIDARLDLANLQMMQRQYPAALATSRAVTTVRTAAQRDRVLYISAFSAMQTGNVADARSRAEELRRLSTVDDYKQRADDMLRFLNQPQRPVQAPVVQAQVDAPAEIVERPVLTQRDSAPATRADMEIILQDVKGTLVELNCAAPARFILETDSGRKTFLVLQPDRLIVTGREGGAQFQCGAQKPAPSMRLQFTIAPEGSNADGVVRAVHF